MLKIVVADDELPIREWLNYCLAGEKDNFFVVGTASDGLQAFELAIKEKPDVVITDIRMPGMDGITLMKNVKQALPLTEFVILTNYADFLYAKQAITYGAKEYILKSELRSSELVQILKEIAEDIFNQQDKQKTEKIQQLSPENERGCTGNHIENNKSITEALNFIHQHYNEAISLADIAKQIYRSPEYFSRLFKEVTGENFSVHIINYRLKKAKAMLNSTDLKITEISFKVGYQNLSYFSRLYKKYMGITPEDERRKNKQAK